ncbi:MAG: Ig-like domain-containing protein [Gemmatimonadaceae bacterium]
MTVQTVDAVGNLISGGSVAVTVVMRAPDGSAAPMMGVVTQASAGGVATFVDLAAAQAGSEMTLVASATGLASATSERFKVDPLPIAIDSTVLRLVPDSAGQAAGLYVFQPMTSASVTLTPGEVMVGAQNGGFLRRIVQVEQTGSAIRVQTVAASLDEVMQNDSLVVRLELNGTPSAAAVQRGLIPSRPPRFVSANSAISGTAGSYTIKNLTLYAGGSADQGLVLTDGTMSLRPTVDLRVVWGGLLRPQSARIAFGGVATFDVTSAVGFSQTLSHDGSVLLGVVTFPFTIPVGPVLVPAVFNVPITLEWSVSAAGKIAIEFGWKSSGTASVGADWTSSGGWSPIHTAALNMVPVLPSPQVNASLTARLGLKATPRLVIAGTVGGDLWAQPYAEGLATVDLLQNQWATSCHSAVQVGVDVDLKILGFVIGAYNKTTTLLDTAWPVCAHSGTITQPPAPVSSVTVSPSTGSIAVGGTQQFSATLKDANGNTLTGRAVVWSSSSSGIATVNSATGVATGVAVGTATITATSEGKTGTATITVSLVPVASVTVSPATASMAVGGTQQFTATLKDASGNTLSGRTVTWSTSDVSIATVNSATGVATGVAAGTTTITALSAGKTGTASMTVLPLGGFVVSEIALGGSFTCALVPTGETFCWGYNNDYQLGDGTRNARATPTRVSGSNSYVQLATGLYHACGRAANGAVYCWGDNFFGQLGRTGFGAAEASLVTGGVTFKSVRAGDLHNCGFAADNTAFCWGMNNGGVLGDGTNDFRSSPVAVLGGLQFTQLAPGGAHTCALAAGKAYCWGQHTFGALGSGSTEDQLTPAPVSTPDVFVQIASGGMHSCALRQDGMLFCWGRNGNGQLGDGTRIERYTPVPVLSSVAFSEITLGGSHTCARSVQGDVYCWGHGFWGQLGDGSKIDRLVPTPVQTAITFARVVAGGEHTCATTMDGIAYCWGANNFGQLGNGSTADSSTPVAVSVP